MIRGTPRKSAARSHYLSVSSTIHETKSGFQTDLPADTSFSRKEGRKEAVFASDKINSLFSHLPHFTSVQWTLSSSKQQQRRQSGFLLPSHASIRPNSKESSNRPTTCRLCTITGPPPAATSSSGGVGVTFSSSPTLLSPLEDFSCARFVTQTDN